MLQSVLNPNRHRYIFTNLEPKLIGILGYWNFRYGISNVCENGPCLFAYSEVLAKARKMIIVGQRKICSCQKGFKAYV